MRKIEKTAWIQMSKLSLCTSPQHARGHAANHEGLQGPGPGSFPGLPLKLRATCLAASLLLGSAAHAQLRPPPTFGTAALNGLGTTGGLSIPGGGTMSVGTLGMGISDAREPQYGPQPRHLNTVLGVGLLPGLEIVGRLAEHSQRVDGYLMGGISDLSVNVKFGLTLGRPEDGLRLAVGAQDVGGETGNFRSYYAVATQPWRQWEATLGLGHSTARAPLAGSKPPLGGVFGGLAWRPALPAGMSLPGTLTLAAEYDGRKALAGARWASPALPAMANGRVTLGLHHSLANGAAMPAATAWTLGLSLPIGENNRKLAAQQPAADRLAALASAPPVTATQSPTALLGEVKSRLVALGLEHVRVGRLSDGGWALTYQNRRFGQNEMDALGIATGIAAQAAPTGVKRLVVVALKQGLPVLTLRTEAPAWRDFLRTGASAALRDVTRVLRGNALDDGVDWLSDQASSGTRLQVQVSPEVAYTVGTELGMADYALAGRIQATVPVWPGGQVVVMAQHILADSRQAEPGRAFASMRQPEGLQTLALHQTLWLGRQAVVGAAIGRFEYGAWGAEGEAIGFVAGREDVVRLRARAVINNNHLPSGGELAAAASYRWVGSPNLWAEVGLQRFDDGSAGPTAVVSRWWGDVGTHLSYRKGGWRQYVGIEFSVPLTPRAAPAGREVHIQGSPSWTRGVRTMVANSSNFVEPRAVRDLELAWSIETHALNAGRMGPAYVWSQLPRIREAYFSYSQ